MSFTPPLSTPYYSGTWKGLPSISGSPDPEKERVVWTRESWHIGVRSEGEDCRTEELRGKSKHFQWKWWLGLKRNTVGFISMKNDEASVLNTHQRGHQRSLAWHGGVAKDDTGRRGTEMWPRRVVEGGVSWGQEKSVLRLRAKSGIYNSTSAGKQDTVSALSMARGAFPGETGEQCPGVTVVLGRMSSSFLTRKTRKSHRLPPSLLVYGL